MQESVDKERELSKQKIKTLLQHVSRLGKERDALKKDKEELEDKVNDLDQGLKRLQTISRTSHSTMQFLPSISLKSEFTQLDEIQKKEEAVQKYESIPDKVKKKMKERIISKSIEKKKKQPLQEVKEQPEKKERKSKLLERPEMFKFKHLTLDASIVGDEAANDQSHVALRLDMLDSSIERVERRGGTLADELEEDPITAPTPRGESDLVLMGMDEGEEEGMMLEKLSNFSEAMMQEADVHHYRTEEKPRKQSALADIDNYATQPFDKGMVTREESLVIRVEEKKEIRFKDVGIQVVISAVLKGPAIRSMHYHTDSQLTILPEKALDEEAVARVLASYVVDLSEERERGRFSTKDSSSSKSKLPKNIIDKEKHSVQDPCKGSCIVF